ncbi:MAG TPA: DUF1839 family protein [Ilumatobacteraceae bacterium]|nr:DUF1839 family protein [Ilumatobacteraceae bacterium]
MTVHSLLPITAASYEHHWLHDDDRDWPETNCYVDLWIEVLNALNLDPLASLAFTLDVGFNGEQWDFFKHPANDLWELYGLKVAEINVWRPLADHVIAHIELGNLLTLEADAYFLPDTAGVSYGTQHQKTTIVPQMIDVDNERLGYFHNRSYFELDGDDFRGVLRTESTQTSLAPYVEVIDTSLLRQPTREELADVAERLVRVHIGNRPDGNPPRELATRITADLPWLRQHPDRFHGYAFGTLRQLGAWASTASEFVKWLERPELDGAAEALASISATAKTCQFKLARVLAGRDVNLDELFDRMSEAWDSVYAPLVRVYGS